MCLSFMKGLPILMKRSKHNQQYCQVYCKRFMITVGVFHSFNQTLEWASGDDSALIDFHEPSSKPKRYVPNQCPGELLVLQVHLSELIAKLT